jgi:hypothetical protein
MTCCKDCQTGPGLLHITLGKFGEADDDLQDVIEVVGDAAANVPMASIF